MARLGDEMVMRNAQYLADAQYKARLSGKDIICGVFSTTDDIITTKMVSEIVDKCRQWPLGHLPDEPTLMKINGETYTFTHSHTSCRSKFFKGRLSCKDTYAAYMWCYYEY